MEKKFNELKELVKNNGIGSDGYPNDVRKQAIDFANDYDWEHEWEAFDPIEACQDAYMAGIWFAIKYMSKE